MSKIFDGGVTAEKIEQWKGQHRKVVRIEVEDGEETHVGYFRRPTMETMAASSKMAKSDEMKGGTVLFDGCWLGGSEFMRTDPVLFVPAMTQLNQLLLGASASLKNV